MPETGRGSILAWRRRSSKVVVVDLDTQLEQELLARRNEMQLHQPMAFIHDSTSDHSMNILQALGWETSHDFITPPSRRGHHVPPNIRFFSFARRKKLKHGAYAVFLSRRCLCRAYKTVETRPSLSLYSREKRNQSEREVRPGRRVSTTSPDMKKFCPSG